MIERRQDHRDLARYWQAARIGYALLLAAIVVGFFRTGDTISENEHQAREIAMAAEDLRLASIDACRRQNDVRQEVATNRDVVRAIVQTSLDQQVPATADPVVRAKFRRYLARLRKPVPLVACETEFPPPVTG